MRNIEIIVFLLVLAFETTAAQEAQLSGKIPDHTVQLSQDSLFKIVEENNTALKAASGLLESSILRARTGNTPSDPEVEFGFLAGFPSTVGDRIDFRVMQEFDFPTAYLHMSRAKDLKIEEAELLYALTRQEILSGAKQLWIERIYLNRLDLLLSERLVKSERLLSHYRKMVETGEAGKLSLSQVNLHAVALRGEMEQIKGDIKGNSEAMIEITGGKISETGSTVFPESFLPEEEIIREAYRQSAEIEYYSSEADLKTVEKQLALSQALPKFKAGYYSETLIDQRFSGISVGLSIPLWENSNRVKYAKAGMNHAAADADRYRSKQKMELAQKLVRMETLLQQANALREALSMVNDDELLGMALEMGEISLSEYIFASDFYFQNVKKLLVYERDMLLLEADMMKVFY